jgi:hypothetical protein
METEVPPKRCMWVVNFASLWWFVESVFFINVTLTNMWSISSAWISYSCYCSSSSYFSSSSFSPSSSYFTKLHGVTSHKIVIWISIYSTSSIFWDIMACSPLKVNGLFRGTCRLHLQGRRISGARNQRESSWQPEALGLAYSSTLKMEATFSCEKSVDFQRTTRHYIPEDRTLHNHRCKNLKSYIIYSFIYRCVINCIGYIASMIGWFMNDVLGKMWT